MIKLITVKVVGSDHRPAVGLFLAQHLLEDISSLGKNMFIGPVDEHPAYRLSGALGRPRRSNLQQIRLK